MLKLISKRPFETIEIIKIKAVKFFIWLLVE
jgi:hypothetical protein